MFILIWFNIASNKNPITITSQTKLRSIINSLFIFHTIDETIQYLKTTKDEKIFLIISDSFGWELLDRNEISQLNSIYIFSQHRNLLEQNSKIHDIFTDIDSLCIRLKEDLKQLLHNLSSISIIPTTSIKNKSIIDKQKQVTFLCSQLHSELLLTMECSTDARINFVEFCMSIYRDNEIEREFIEELRNEYHPSKAIWW